MIKKLVLFAGVLAPLCIPVMALGMAGPVGQTAAGVPFWMCVPFAGLLLSIAVLPLFRPFWWEHHRPWVVALWSLLFLIPFGWMMGADAAVEIVLECMVNDYLSFIVLLFGLFCVSGNITLEGDLAGSPRVNVVLLLFGTLLSSWVGTTGASMLMVRPMIKKIGRAHV